MVNIAYLAIDPGETNGIAAYDENGVLLWCRPIKHADLTDFLLDIEKLFAPLQLIIVENYLVYPNKAKQHVYSKLTTVRMLGEIDGFAKARGIKVQKQNATIKNVGYKWMGRKPLPKSDPMNHAFDAHAHGLYWLVTHHIVDPSTLLKDRE